LTRQELISDRPQIAESALPFADERPSYPAATICASSAPFDRSARTGDP
jgi:hypothetical protein